VIVPEDVIGPPDKPVPVLTRVTVPGVTGAGFVFEMVRLPPVPEMLIPTPAVRLRMPVLVTVTTPPVFADTKMPDPARMVEIPPGPDPPALIVPVRLSM
jgi:hypothetical protein